MAKRIDVEGLSAWFGSTQALADVSITVEPKQVTAIIGPSGCGKSTFLRALNRMHEVVPGARVAGQVLLDGEDIYADGVDPVAVRRSIGMVFQRPNPFPTMSVRDNLGFALDVRSDSPGEITKRVEELAAWLELGPLLERRQGQCRPRQP